MPDLKSRPPFPRVIDNSMRSAFVECPRRFWLRYIHHLALPGSNLDLHAGAVAAKGFEVVRRKVYVDGWDVNSALVAAFREMAVMWGDVDAGDSVKSFERVVGCVEYYFRTAFPPAIDHIQPARFNGVPAIEWNFVEPIDMKHPETGEPILYTGRFDMFGVLSESALVIVDEKTTKQLGTQWSQRWKLRSQFTGYAWGAQKYGHNAHTAIIRGIAFRAAPFTYDHMEAVVPRMPWMIEVWYEQLLRDVKRMIQSWESNYFDWNLGETCAAFGGCMFLPLCDTPTPENWISGYIEEQWNPLTRNAIPILKAAA